MASTLDGGECRSRGPVHQSISYIRITIKARSYSGAVRPIRYRKAGLSCCSNTNTVPMAPVSLDLHEARWSIAAWHSQGRWHSGSSTSSPLISSSLSSASPSAIILGSISCCLVYCKCPTLWPKCLISMSRSTKLQRGPSVSIVPAKMTVQWNSHVHVEIQIVIFFLRIHNACHRFGYWQQGWCTSLWECRNDMGPSDNLSRVQKGECIIIQWLNKANFWQVCVVESMVIWTRLHFKPTYLQELHRV